MSANHIANFVHVGLGKCASTFLQGVWSKSPDTSFLNLLPLAKQLKLGLQRGTKITTDNIKMPSARSLENTVIASSEGLSWGFLNRPRLQNHVKEIPDYSSRMLSQLRLSDTVLIMVRDPLDWIRSAHEQSLKEAGWASASVFLTEQRKFVRDVLNVAHLHDCFAKRFRRVVILSADELRANPDRFWNRYEEHLDVQRPDGAIIASVNAKRASNTSLGDRVVHLAKLNRTLQTIADAYAGLRSVPAHVEKEREVFLPEFQKSISWIARRTIEHADGDVIRRVSEMNAGIDEETFFGFQVDDKMTRHLRANFIAPLREHAAIDSILLDQYETRLTCIEQGEMRLV